MSYVCEWFVCCVQANESLEGLRPLLQDASNVEVGIYAK